MTDETSASKDNSEASPEESPEESASVAGVSDDAESRPLDDHDAADAGEAPTDDARPKQLPARIQRALPFLVTAFAGIVVGALFFGGDPPPPPDSGASSPAHEHGAEKADVWTCSMHPQIQQDGPGQCPICGMDLIPLETGQAGDDSAPARVELSDRAKTIAAIRTAPVRKLGDASRDIRLLGRIDHDETRVRTVTAWTGGRIDRLRVANVGEKVGRGETIATLYSPEVYAAHRDLLQAQKQVSSLAPGMEFARTSAKATLESARQKLRLLGVSEHQLDKMAAESKPRTQIAISSPFRGTVLEKLVTEGTYVQPGTPLYKIADLSRVWVQLDAYESDLPSLRLGQHVSLTIEALPAETFEGTVAFVDPVIDAAKRTARVRVEVLNEDERLRPGMFAEAVVQGGGALADSAQLVIPASAPLFSGRRSIVYVEVPDPARPTYEAREVKLGPKAGEVFPVVAGLAYGERIVVNGAFAIDADLQIRGGSSLMNRGDDSTAGQFDSAFEVNAAFREGLRPIIESYLAVQKALADDDFDRAKSAAAELVTNAESFAPDSPAEAVAAWSRVKDELSSHGSHMQQVRDIEGAREAFAGFSAAISRALKHFGNPTDRSLSVAYCPMAFNNRGGEWVQEGTELDNSYFGESMLRCGEIRTEIRAGTHLGEQPAEPPEQPSSAPAGGHKH